MSSSSQHLRLPHASKMSVSIPCRDCGFDSRFDVVGFWNEANPKVPRHGLYKMRLAAPPKTLNYNNACEVFIGQQAFHD